MFEELIATQHRICVLGELAKHPKLSSGERQLLSGFRHNALLATQFKIAETYDLIVALIA